MSRYAYFLAEHGESEDDNRQADQLKDKVVALLNTGKIHPTAVYGQWYEFFGDRVADHLAASKIYQIGLITPVWSPLWVKGIGCLSLIPENKDRLDHALAGLSSPKAALICRKAVRQYHLQNPSEWVRERWLAGVEVFKSRFRESPEVQSVTAKFTDTRNRPVNWRPTKSQRARFLK